MFRGILFALVIGIAAASSADQYIDNVLRTALPRELISARLDPAILSNFHTVFGTQGIYQNQGQVDFTYGNATGLNRVRRKTCAGPKLVRGEYTVNCTLSFFPIVTAYKTVVRNGSHIYNVRNQGHVAETLVYVGIAGSNTGSVKTFRVERLGAITPTFYQVPNQLIKYVSVWQNAYRQHVSAQLYNVLQQQFVYALGRALAYTPIPRQ